HAAAVDPVALVESARDWAAFGQAQDPYLTKVSPQPAVDRQGQTVPRETLMAGSEAAIALCREADAKAVCSGTWEAVDTSWELANSAGLHCAQGRQWVEASLVAERVEGDDWLVVSETVSAEGEIDPRRLVQPIVERLQWSRKRVAMPTGRLPIVLAPGVVDWWLAPVLAALSAQSVRLGVSPWGDRRGMAVAGPHLTLVQQPSARYGLPFDEEGTPTQPFAWIERGVLQGFTAIAARSRKLANRPGATGFAAMAFPNRNCFRFAWSPGGPRRRNCGRGPPCG
ncbi:MAG: hypothetical protein HC918_05550, partial [Oscillatoriales cyanobacterium SM2_1_8]|nr:hypothetical protein [Oscillatoriales cyanobacterium SM2_1_8]